MGIVYVLLVVGMRVWYLNGGMLPRRRVKRELLPILGAFSNFVKKRTLSYPKATPIGGSRAA